MTRSVRAAGGSKGWRRVALVVLGTLALVYGLRLTGIGWSTRLAGQTAAAMATRNAAMLAQVEALETAAAEATTDAGAERWAREEMGWSRPGDRSFTLVAAGDPTPSPSPTPIRPGLRQRMSDWWRGGG